MSSPRSSILVVSDLHLGATLRPPLDDHALDMVDRLDVALEHFLDYHLAHPVYTEVGELVPWTLVFNGDTIDFLHMGLTVAEHIQLEAEEALYGLSFARRRLLDSRFIASSRSRCAGVCLARIFCLASL